MHKLWDAKVKQKHPVAGWEMTSLQTMMHEK